MMVLSDINIIIIILICILADDILVGGILVLTCKSIKVMPPIRYSFPFGEYIPSVLLFSGVNVGKRQMLWEETSALKTHPDLH